MVNHIHDYLIRFGLLILVTLISLTVGAESALMAGATPTAEVDTKATIAAQTIEAVLHSTRTLTPTPTPNKSETATALAAQIQTEVAAALTANPTVTPTPTPTLGQAALVQTAVAATLTAQVTPTPTPTPTPGSAAQIQTAVAATLTANPGALPADTPTPTSTPKVAKAPTRVPTKTPRPTAPPKATNPPPPTEAPAVPARPDLVTDFENLRGVWQRGNETWGTLTQSSENKTSGATAVKLVYDFTPAQPTNDFVIFLHKPALAIPGQPKGINMQVYGDGSGNFLNTWVQDSAGQIWQFTFGRITHTGWQMMSAPLDPGLGWPNGVVQNNQSGNLSYPLQLYALVLDGEPRQVMQGTLFFDDLLTTDNPARPNLGGGAAAPAPAPAATSAAATPPAAGPENIPDQSCGVDPQSITAGQTALLYWKFTGVKAVYLDGQGVLGIGSKLVKPGQTTTYTVRAVRSDGSEVACPITVQVK